MTVESSLLNIVFLIIKEDTGAGTGDAVGAG